MNELAPKESGIGALPIIKHIAAATSRFAPR